MVYTYTPAGRLESEVREGQVWYSRHYGYNLDGSRAMVMRDDALNGAHWDVYAYDPVSGRLASVQDALTGEVYNFVWNPEGTLARWENNAPNGYARVFGYDEEGRLVKIERDYGSGGVQVAYEYGYNSDGVRVWKRDVLNGQEYRYVCRIGCGGVPMRLYNRVMSGGSWTSVEDYLPAGNALGYNENWQYRHTGGELLLMGTTGEPSGYYPMDSNGLAVQNAPAQPCMCLVAPVSVSACPPLGYGACAGGECGDIPPLLPPNPSLPAVPNPIHDQVYHLQRKNSKLLEEMILSITRAFGALGCSAAARGAADGTLDACRRRAPHNPNCDKLAHCVGACVARKCGTILLSWCLGILKEFSDWANPLDEDTWDSRDLAANHEGEKCAKADSGLRICATCCLRKFPIH